MELLLCEKSLMFFPKLVSNEISMKYDESLSLSMGDFIFSSRRGTLDFILFS